MADPSIAVTVRSHVRRLLVILLTLLVAMSPTAADVGVASVASVANGAGGAFNTQDFTNNVNAAVHQAPIGSFDAATPYGDTVAVAGWTLEPSDRSVTTQVHVYINATGYALTTSTMRTDVNNAYGATGTHGFRATLPLPTGTSTICAYAVSLIGNGNTLLSCRNVVRTATPPIGFFDAATPSGDTVTVSGWTLEPSDRSVTTQVHVYINATGYALTTSTMRTDVNNAYGATGTHGFKATLPLPTGTSTICAYAVSLIGNGNTLLSCRTVTGNAPPIGYFDAATPSGDTVTVSGWTLEPSDRSVTTQVHVYINATGYALTTTSLRTDVNNAYGATGTHGFKATLPLPPGTSTICAYAVSLIGNGNTLISCRTVQSGGFPDATNTGVPNGTVLTNYTGPTTITTAGTVIDSKKITGCIVIQANNVTIRNSLLQTNGCFFNVLSDNGNTGLQLVDVEIDGQNNSTGDSAINGGGFTCLRCNLHGTVDGIKAQSNVVVRDSWIHDLTITNRSHNDGIQSLGTTSLQILHNTIIMADGATAAVILSTGSASNMRNVTIDGNLLGGGAFTVYGGYQPGTDDVSKISNIAVTNNEFTTAIFPHGGAFGPLTSVSPPVVVSGNTWADGPNAGGTVN